MNRLRDLLIDGLLLALPLGAAAYLLREMARALKVLLLPVMHFAPEARWFGIVGLELLVLIALLLLLLLLGVFSRSALGQRLANTLEQLVLNKIPGYMIFKSIAADMGGTDEEGDMHPAWIAFDDNAVLGFVMDGAATGAHDDPITVFIPSAPTAGSGSVVIVPRSRVTWLQVSTNTVRTAMKQRGLGLQKLLKPTPETPLPKD